MAIAIKFSPEEMTRAKYDESIRLLEKAGLGRPEGRLYHVCYTEGDYVGVTDVWDSMENFERFGQTLMSILADLAVNPGQPEIREVHHIIEG